MCRLCLTGQSLQALVTVVVALALMLSVPVEAVIRPKLPAQEPPIAAPRPPPPAPKLSLAVWVDRTGHPYVIGETVKFSIQVKHEDAHVVIQFDNQVPLFPESNQPPLLVKAGKTATVACQSAGATGKRSFTIIATAIGANANEPHERIITVPFEEPDVSIKHATAPQWHCRAL
jgi:hypothetical protein